MNISSQTRNKIQRKQNKTIPTIKKSNTINYSNTFRNLTSDFLFSMKNNLNNQERILNHHSQQILNHIQSILIPPTSTKKTNLHHQNHQQCLNCIVNIKLVKEMCFYNVKWNDLNLDDLEIETMETIKNVFYQLEHDSSTRKKIFFCFKKYEPHKHIENILKKNVLDCENVFYTKMKHKKKTKEKKRNLRFENIDKWFLDLFYKLDIENKWNPIFSKTQFIFKKILKFFEKQISNIYGSMRLIISDWSGIVIFLHFIKKCTMTNKIFMI